MIAAVVDVAGRRTETLAAEGEGDTRLATSCAFDGHAGHGAVLIAVCTAHRVSMAQVEASASFFYSQLKRVVRPLAARSTVFYCAVPADVLLATSNKYTVLQPRRAVPS